MGKNLLTAHTLYLRELEKAVGTDCETLLDIGCGSDSPIKFFSERLHAVGIDAHIPSLEKSMKKGIHDKYFNMTFSELDEFESCAFDCVIALDVVEHIRKDEGLRLLDNMERIAKKKIVVVTPNGFLPSGAYDNNPWQIHRSGWTTKEMRMRGYKVIGIIGLKTLRGERAILRFNPKPLWEIVSTLTQYIVRNHPEFAFEILCIKSKARVLQSGFE
jgi:SAM-dependent methyltransferase